MFKIDITTSKGIVYLNRRPGRRLGSLDAMAVVVVERDQQNPEDRARFQFHGKITLDLA
jgi:hypothetical protein